MPNRRVDNAADERSEIASRLSAQNSRYLHRGPICAALLVFMTVVVSPLAVAQINNDFNVTVNTGPVAPNSATVLPGEATSLRITLANNSTTAPLTNVNFNQSLPVTAGHSLLINGASSIAGDPGCSGGTLTTTPGTPGVVLSALTVPVRDPSTPGSGECYIDLPIVPTSSNGSATSLAYALNAGDVGSDQGTNVTGGPQSITIRSASRPTWSKGVSVNDILVLGGATRTLEIEINNPDANVTHNNLGFVDLFPTSGPDGAIAEPTGTLISNSCGGTVTQNSGAAASVSLSGGSLGPSASCTIEVEIRGRQTNGVYNRSVDNVLPASTFTSDAGIQPAGDAVQRFRARSPLAVTKNFNPNIVASGEVNSFRITLTNSGSVALPITNFTDDPIAAAPFSDRLSIAAVGDISNSCAGGTETLESGGEGFTVAGFSIPANGSCNIDVTYTGITPGSDAPTTYTNAIAQGDVQTSVPGIVSQARSATVLVADRLRVLKSVDPGDASPGDPVRYDITIENYAAAPISNVTVDDTLQNGATLLLGGAFAPTLTPACGVLDLNGAAQGDSAVTFTISALPARVTTNTPGTCVISFSAMLDPDGTGSTSNEIAAGAVCFGPGPTCNTVGSGPVTTNDLTTLLIEKTIDGIENAVKIEGTPARLEVVVENNSVNPLTSLTLSDTLPSAGPFQQLRVATPANIVNTCGGTVTAAEGSTSVALNGGTVPPFNGTDAGTCSLSVDIVGPAGVYPNTANASAVRQNGDGSTTNVLDDDDATLTYNGALSTAKSFDPTATSPGGLSRATIRFTSLDPMRPITGIALTDNLPLDMVVANPPNVYTTCGGGATVSATPGSSSVSLSGAVLAPDGECELIFDVEVSGSADWTNTIPAGGISADGGLTNLSPISATLTFVAPSAPLISKTLSPGSIVPGEFSRLTVTITNGTQDISNVTVSDFFTVDGLASGANNGMTIAPTAATATDCVGGLVVPAMDGSSVRLEGANLLASTSCEFSVNVTTTSVGTTTNTIPFNSISTDEGATNDSTFAQSALSITSDVGIGKTFTPPVVSPGEVSVLRITLFNGRNQALTGLSLVDDFPAGLELAPTPDPFSSCGGGVSVSFPTTTSVRIDNGSVQGATSGQAASCIIEVNVVSATEGTYVNTINADTLLSNGTPVPHPAVDATLQVRERLIVHKAFDDLTLDAGDPEGFTTGVAARLPGDTAPFSVRIRNPNTIPLTAVNFVDELPAGLVLAAPTALSTDCTGGVVNGDPSGRELRLTGATLGAVGAGDDVCTVSAQVVSNVPGIYTNEIPGGGVVSAEGIDNLPGTMSQIIITEPPTISKDFSPPVVAAGVASTLSIIIGNDNDLDTSLSADLVDNLPGSPGQMEVATPPNITTDCPGGAGIVTAAAGATAITIDDGSVIPAGGCVVSVDVTAPVDGNYLNFIPVGALQTTFGVNDAPAEAILRVSSLGYISGKVFLDNQTVPDGTYLPGSSGPIAGNVIELRSGPDCSGALLASTTTDMDGNYLFADLLAGTYSVCQTSQPTDTLNSVTTAGTIESVNGSTGTAGTAANPLSMMPTSQITSIVLSNSGAADEVSGSPDNNFSEVLPASIGGTVFFDADGNGVFDPAEDGIGGVTINLTGPVNLTVTTDVNGNYLFEDLPPGNYTVTEVQPAAFTDGTDVLGTVGGSTQGNTSANDEFSSITLGPGDKGIDYDLGEELVSASLVVTANASCSNDAPMIDYDIPLLSGGASPSVTVRLLTVGARLVGTFSGQPVSRSLLWPGVTVDGSGMGIGWPGWVFNGTEWVQTPDDRMPTMVVEVTVGGATASTTVNYPNSTSGCLTQPPGTGPTSIPVLPWPILLLLILLTGFGGVYSLRKAPPAVQLGINDK